VEEEENAQAEEKTPKDAREVFQENRIIDLL